MIGSFKDDEGCFLNGFDIDGLVCLVDCFKLNKRGSLICSLSTLLFVWSPLLCLSCWILSLFYCSESVRYFSKI